MLDYTAARANMVDNQLRPNQVSNAAIQRRFALVAREEFLSPAVRNNAYLDAPAPQGTGTRQVFSPLTAARLIQALNPQPDESVLVLAGGSGYTAAILAGLAAQVTLIEEDETLLAQARANLSVTPNVTFIQANPAHPKLPGSYSAILLDAPAGEIPTPILNLLPEGGRLAAVRTGADGLLEAVLLTRNGKTLFTEVLFETKGTILPAFTAQERFVF